MNERFFNNAGPVDCAEHYCLDPLQRIDLEAIEELIAQKRYFVLHAPRQTGKTSSLLALMHHLNAQGRYRCLYVNVEIAQSAREDVGRAMRAILSELGSRATYHLDDPWLARTWSQILETSGPEAALIEVLTRAAEHGDRPLVLLIDEIDALIGDSLISVLRQIRAGYDKRPRGFPQTVILCGVRDVRDYRIRSSRSQEIITGGSAFNIKAESIRLGDFSATEVRALYDQHSAETGQPFTPEAIERVWHWTRGQPWLVNAIGYEVTFRRKDLRDRTRTIDEEAIDQAAETLIERRDTHLDQLTDKLREARVRRVIEAILTGDEERHRYRMQDVEYLIDLGLIRRYPGGRLVISNPIYREIIPRDLTRVLQSDIHQEQRWYLRPDGQLDLVKLLTAFQAFFREHSEHWIERFDYKEAGPQLLMQAFLQRIVNGGGRIEREYGLGRMRTDLLVIWPHAAGVQKVVIELKILRKGLESTIAQCLEQTLEYLDRCGGDEAHLVIFDRSDKPWKEKLFRRIKQIRHREIEVWGM